MARVNHKKVKQLIQERRGKISDREFFTSRLLALHFEDIAAAQTKRYGSHRPVRVHLTWEPDASHAACTNNLTIHINAGNPIITQFPTREERRALRNRVESELERARTAGVHCAHLTGVGGTIRAAAKLYNACSGADPANRVIPAEELRGLYKELKKGDQGTLRQILRTAPDRVHTILPGLVILNAVVKSYGVETISVSACGVREGYLLQRVMGVENHDE